MFNYEKKSAIVIIALFFSISFYAQNNHRFGIVFGPNIFSLRGDYLVDNTKSGFGGFFGVSYVYKFYKHFSIVTGISLDKKRINYSSHFTKEYINNEGMLFVDNYLVETVNEFNYFSIPLLLRFSFAKNNSFFINGGFYLATTQSIKRKTKVTNETKGYNYNTPTTTEYNFLLADHVEGPDYGVSFGFGKSFKLNSKTDISIEIRDNLGLNNAVANIDSYGVKGIIKTNSLNLIAQLSFDL